MHITGLYVALGALLVLILSARVSARRMSQRIGLGDGDDRELRKRIRVQANAIEYLPLALLLLGALLSSSVGLFVLLAAIFAFIAALIITKTYLFAFAALAIIVLAAAVFINFKKRQRVEKFTEQMPEVLSMISRSLRAGHSMTSAVELVGSEMANPAGELFKIAYEQQKLGLSITDTIANMTNRIESLDLRFFITTVAINSATAVGFEISMMLEPSLAASWRVR